MVGRKRLPAIPHRHCHYQFGYDFHVSTSGLRLNASATRLLRPVWYTILEIVESQFAEPTYLSSAQLTGFYIHQRVVVSENGYFEPSR